MTDGGEYDYIVIGGGSAGCVVAARLSESPDVTVLLLEEGERDANFWLHVPIGFAKIYGDKRWFSFFKTEAEPGMDGKPGVMPLGRVLGGGSSVNGMVYIRGQREDYDDWRQLGNEGWDYDSVLPFFRKSEDQQRGADAFHGIGGPLGVSDVRERNPLCDAFVEAGVQAGLRRNPDFNGAFQDGVGRYQSTTRRGRRCSTAVAYLKPARRRPNLHVLTGAAAERVVIEGGHARAVEYLRGGERVCVRARREIVICAGGMASPLLLQRSGVGPGEILRQAGIPVLRDMPGVGRNLRNHCHGWLAYHIRQRVTLNERATSLAGRLGMGLHYMLTRAGPMAEGPAWVGAFLRSDPAVASPDVQVQAMLFSMNRQTGKADEFPAMSFCITLLRPESHGFVEVRGPKLGDEPAIRFNYLAAERDQRTLVAGLKQVRGILSRPALADFVGKAIEFEPHGKSDDEILAYIRERRATAHHLAASCRMGNEERAVVDARLRVHGIAGLRVADASVMPTLVSGNTNAPTIMIAEKCAAMMLEDARGVSHQPA